MSIKKKLTCYTGVSARPYCASYTGVYKPAETEKREIIYTKQNRKLTITLRHSAHRRGSNCVRKNIVRTAYTEATQPPQRHYTRHLPGHCCRQIDKCVSGLVGLPNAADLARLEGFLRRCVWLGFRLVSSPTLASVCDEADNRLFTCINHDPRHLLWPLLPPTRDDHYNMRKRHHNLQLPERQILRAIMDSSREYFIKTLVATIQIHSFIPNNY